MDSSFVEGVCFDNNRMVRELNREKEGVEFPLFRGLYLKWLEKLSNLTPASQKSYLSYLKALDEQVFMQYDEMREYFDPFIYLKNGFLTRDWEYVLEVVSNVDQLLTSLIVENDEDAPESFYDSDLRNWRSAWRKYGEFIEYLVIYCKKQDAKDSCSKVENPTTTETVRPASIAFRNQKGVECLDDSGTMTVVYDADAIFFNFRNRLRTQCRMTEDKKVFYPIRLIDRIIRESGRTSRRTGAPNNDGEWMDKLFYNEIQKIKVYTNKGVKTLADVDSITIYPKGKQATAKLKSGENVKLLSKTALGNETPMLVESLRDIHIDHSPLMDEILSKNEAQLKAMAELTAIIRKAAGNGQITGQSPKLTAKVMETVPFEELQALIPELKKELTLLSSQYELQLMLASENLSKK